MRTTVDIPDDLFRRAKSEAALRGRRLKDLVEEGLRLLLDNARPSTVAEAKPGKQKPRPGSLHDLLQDLCGIIKDGPDDLASNPKHLEGFGE